MSRTKQSLSTITHRKVLRLTSALVLAIALVVGFLTVPALLTPQSSAVTRGLPLPFQASQVHAANGLTITKYAISDIDPTAGLPSFVGHGQVLTYVVQINNNTGTAVDGFFITDTVPANAICLNVETVSTFADNAVTCQTVGRAVWSDDPGGTVLANGSTTVFTWSVVITAPLADGTVITNNNYRFDSVANNAFDDIGVPYTTTVQAPEFTINKQVSPTVAQVGDRITYTLFVTNTGALTAGIISPPDVISPLFASVISVPIVVNDVFPNDVVTGSVGFQGPADNGVVSNTVVFTLPGDTQLGINETLVFTFGVDVAASAAALGSGGLITNPTYSVSGSEVFTGATGTFTAPVTLSAPVTLTINKFDSADPLTLAAPLPDVLTYTIVVTAEGAGANGVIFTDTVPEASYLSYNSASIQTGNGSIDDSNLPAVVFDITGTVAAGDVITAVVVLDVTESLTNPVVITNSVEITATGAEVVVTSTQNALISGQFVQTTTLQGQNALDIAKTVEPTIAQPGDLLTYTITITNAGTGVTSGVFSDNLNAAFNPMLPLAYIPFPELANNETFTTVFYAVVGDTTSYTVTALDINDYVNNWVPTGAWNRTATDMSIAGALTNDRVVFNGSGGGLDASSCDVLYVNATHTFTAGTDTVGYIEVRRDSPFILAGWTIAAEFRESTNGPVTTVANINELVGDNMAYLRFRYASAAGGSWTIDDVGVQCLAAAPVDTTDYNALSGGTGIFSNTAITAVFTDSGTLSQTSVISTAPVEIASNTITVTKVATWTPQAPSNGAALVTLDQPATITYTFYVTNTGTRPVNVDLTDNSLPTPDIPLGTLALGEVVSETRVITVSDLSFLDSALLLTNTVTGSAEFVTPPVGLSNAPYVVSTTASVPITFPVSITVSKTFTASTVPVPKDTTIDYTITITNESPITVTVASSAFTETLFTDSSDFSSDLSPSPMPPYDIGPGEAQTVDVSYTVVQTTINAAAASLLLTNTVAAQANESISGFTSVVESVTVEVPLTATTQITLSKTIDPSSPNPATVGDTIVYRFTITNTGSFTITSLSDIADDLVGTVTAPALPGGVLAIDASVSVTATLPVTQGLIESTVSTNFYLTNTAVITAFSDVGTSGPVTDTATIPLTFTVQFDVAKLVETSAPEPLNVGDVVTYSIGFENTGNVTATVHYLTDTFNAPSTRANTAVLSGFVLDLPPGGVVTETDVITINQQDIIDVAATGFLTNTAEYQAIMGGLGPSPVFTATADVELDSQIQPDFSKTVTPTVAGLGDVVTYTYVITNNTGAAFDLDPTFVTTNTDGSTWLFDDQLDLITIAPANVTSTVTAGDSITVTVAHTINTADFIAAGAGLILTNTGYVETVVGSVTLAVSDTAAVQLLPELALAVSKSVLPTAASVGEVVTYTLTVQNLDSVTVSIQSNFDTILGTSITALNGVNLGPGDVVSETVAYPISLADYAAAAQGNVSPVDVPLTNTLVVTAQEIVVPFNATITGTGSTSLTVSLGDALVLEKIADDISPSVGQTVNYTAVVTNNSSSLVTVTSITDPQIPGGTSTTPFALTSGNGQSEDLGSRMTVSSDTGGFTNIITATIDTTGGSIVLTDDVTIAATFEGALVVDKFIGSDLISTTAQLGDSLDYRFIVTNVGTILVEDIQVNDPSLSFTSIQFDLGAGSDRDFNPPNQTMTSGLFTFDATLNEFVYVNVVTVTGVVTDPSLAASVPVTATDVYTVVLDFNPALDVSKTASSPAVGQGQTITYTVRITNTGDTPYTAITATDALAPSGFTFGTLNPGVSVTETYTFAVPMMFSDSAITNTVIVTGQNILTQTVVSAEEVVEVVEPLASVVLTTTLPVSDFVGTPRAFTATVAPTTDIGTVIYTFDFGDSSMPQTTAMSTTNYTYTLPGIYTVTVVADNGVTSVTDFVVVEVIADTAFLVVNKTAAPPDGSAVGQGGTIVYTVTVANIGSAAATNVLVTDTLPADLESVTSDVGTVAGGLVTLSPGTLTAGSTITMVISGTVAADAIIGSSVVNEATATSTEFNTTTPATVTHFVAGANLAITKEATPPDGSLVAMMERITYTVRVTNTGTITADNVIITDTLPAGATVILSSTTQGMLTTVGNDLVISGSINLPAGDSIVVTIATQADGSDFLIINEAVASADNVPPVGPASTTHNLDGVPFFEVNKTAVPASGPIQRGETIDYTIVITNVGTALARDFLFTDTLPAGLLPLSGAGTFVADYTGGVTILTRTGSIYNVGILNTSPPLNDNFRAGEVLTVTIQAAVPGGAAIGTIYTNTAQVNSTDTGLQTSNDITHVVSLQELEITKSASPASGSRFLPGTNIEYYIQVTNPGPFPVPNVVFTDTIDNFAALTNTTVITGGNATVTDDGSGEYVFNAGTLLVGETVNITITAEAAFVTSETVVTNTAVTFVEGQTFTDTVTHTIAADPVLSIVKSATPPSGSDVPTGAYGTYAIVISNTGPVDATGVVITDQLTLGPIVLDVVNSDTFSGPDAGGVITFTVGTLAPNTPITRSIFFTVTSMTDGETFTNTAFVSAQNTFTPGVLASNAVFHRIFSRSELTVTKIASPTSGSLITLGDTIRYTIRVTNAGNITANNVLITDVLDINIGDATLPGSQTTSNGQALTLDLSQPDDIVVVEVDSVGGTSILAPGESLTVTFDVLVNANGAPNSIITNTAEAAFDTRIVGSNPVTHVFPAAPMLSLNKVADPPSGSQVRPGDFITYTVTLTNSGGPTTQTVRLVDTITPFDAPNQQIVVAGNSPELTFIPPSGNSLVLDAAPGLGMGVYTVTFSLEVTGTVAVSGTVITNTVSGQYPPTQVFSSAQTIHTVIEDVEPPALAIEKTAVPVSGSLVEAGDTISYTISLTVTGSTASNVVITDVWTNQSYVVGTLNSGSLSLGSLTTDTFVLTTTALATGTYDITFQAVVSGTGLVSGTLATNQVMAIADGVSVISDSTQHTVVTETVLSVLAIQKTADPASGSTVSIGDTITYTVSLTVTGNSASNVVITDVWANQSYVSGTLSSADFSVASLTNDTLVLNATSLATGTYDITFQAVVSGTDVTTATNAVTASADGVTPVSDSTQHTVVTETVLSPVLTIQKTADPASGSTVSTGDTITYTVSLTVTGNSASNVVITDVWTNQSYVSGTLSSVGFSVASLTTDTLVLNATALATGTYDITFQAVVSGTDVTTATNAVTASADGVTPVSDSTQHPVAVDMDSLYLPVILRVETTVEPPTPTPTTQGLPNLVVTDARVVGGSVQITIQNIGTGPAIPTAPNGTPYNGYWVDFYAFTPVSDPGIGNIFANREWQYFNLVEQVDLQGKVWFVTSQLLPGESLTLTENDAFYDASRSIATIDYGTYSVLYSQVDSVNLDGGGVPYAAVLETHENEGGAYDNVSTAVFGASTTSAATIQTIRPLTGSSAPSRGR